MIRHSESIFMEGHADAAIPEALGPSGSLEEISLVLERTGDFRILRPLKPRTEYTAGLSDTETRTALILDCEATGLDTRRSELIELGMLKFTYQPDGCVGRVLDTFAAYNEPAVPVPAEITELTGITKEMVTGHRLDPDKVAYFAADASVVIAHHAAYARRLVERYFPLFEHVPWACSATQIHWRSLGFDGARLGQLLARIGLFHDAHRALDDCRAVLEVLAFRPDSGPETFLGTLLNRARRKSIRIWAEQSPFEMKDQL
ncbi:MAG: polymerase subunit epsilon [Bradyrhizobium sp.]|nr:polymerase subunit epsilon [Bradyrhizobium sp.]